MRSLSLGNLNVALKGLAQLDPTSANVAQLRYAIASAIGVRSERRNALLELVGRSPERATPEPVATWLRQDTDAEVRATAWQYTVSTGQQAREMLATERSLTVRAAVGLHPELTDAERTAAVTPLRNAGARMVATNPDRFDLDLVLAAMRLLWAKGWAKGSADDREALDVSLASPAVREAIIAAEDTPLEMRLAALVVTAEHDPSEEAFRAATSLVVQMVYALTDNTWAYPGFVNGSVTFEHFSALLDKLSWNPRATLGDVQLFRNVFSAGPTLTPGWCNEAHIRLRKPVGDRAWLFGHPTAVRFIEQLSDPELRAKAAAARILRARDTDVRFLKKVDPDAETVLDLYGRYLGRPAHLALADRELWPGTIVPQPWMLNYPELMVDFGVHSAKSFVNSDVLDGEDENSVWIRTQIGERLLAGEKGLTLSDVIVPMVTKGWVREEDFYLIPLALLPGVMSMHAPELCNLGVRATVITDLLGRLIGETPEQTRVALEVLLKMDHGPRSTSMETLLMLVEMTVGDPVALAGNG